jgi:uncharacterized protein (DUF58 family)
MWYRVLHRTPALREGHRTVAALVFAAVLATVCGYFVHANGYTLAVAVVAILIAGLVIPRAAALRLRGSLRFERNRIREGECTSGTVRVSNGAPWPVVGIGIAGEGFGENCRGLHLSWLGAGRSREITTRLGPLPRGEYPTQAAVLNSVFPLTLVDSGRPLETPDPLLVWPRTFPTGGLPESDLHAYREGNFESRRIGSGGDLAGLRPFRHGDSLRQIHWQQSARHDRLIVCERQATRLPRVRIVLDTDPSSHAHSEGDDSGRNDGTLEWGIRIAASLAESWLRGGAEAGVIFGDRVLPPGGGEWQLRAVLDLAARVPRTGSPFAATRRLLERERDDALTVLVSTDLGLCDGASSMRSDPSLWFVVLSNDGFGGASETIAVQTPRSHTLRISEPKAVPGALRRGWAGPKRDRG